MTRAFRPRRSTWIDIDSADPDVVPTEELALLTQYDLIYRTLVAIQFNFAIRPSGTGVPAGHIMTAALFDPMQYDLGDPVMTKICSLPQDTRQPGHAAMWALRDEVARIASPELLPKGDHLRLRWEDLLGFRRNPTQPTPLFKRFGSKPLDGHPTPMTPFVRIATGPSGVGMGSSIGLAFAAADYFGANAPRIHILEGEGGLTPGRVYESLAAAGSSGLSNAICHLDWNQASIDSDQVTRESDSPGEYVQWDPMELFYLHDWNVVYVKDSFDIGQVLTGQRRALAISNGQPTAVVYRTEKGFGYGITGKKSHGGGHKRGSEAYIDTLRPLLGNYAEEIPQVDDPGDAERLEACHWATLEMLRDWIRSEANDVCQETARRLEAARDGLDKRQRSPRAGGSGHRRAIPCD